MNLGFIISHTAKEVNHFLFFGEYNGRLYAQFFR